MGILLALLLAINFSACQKEKAETANPFLPSQELLDSYDLEFQSYLQQANGQMNKEVLRYVEFGPSLLPKKVSIEGTHYELGYLIGLVTKAKFGSWHPTRNTENEAINQQIEQMYEELYPPYLDLLRGVAEARGLTLDEVDLRYMEHEYFMGAWWYLLNYQKFIDQTDFSCSLASYFLEREGRQLVGRNFDNQSDRPHFLVSTRMEGSYAVLGNSCYMPYHWVTDGMNEKGLFIGVATNGNPARYNQKEGYNYPNVPAVQVIHMVRIALEKCANVEEAISLFQSVRIWFPEEFNHLLLADADGAAAVLEWDPDKNAHVFRRDKPYLLLTNTAYLEGLDFIERYCSRYQKAKPMLETGIGDVSQLFDVMKGIQFTAGETRTLWTAMFDLSTLEMDVRYRAEGFSTPHRERIE